MTETQRWTTSMMGLALAVLGAMALPAHAATAVTDPGNMELRNNGSGNWTGNTGYEFTVGKQDLAVTSLGIYDAPGNQETTDEGQVGDGLENEAVVTIYETKGRTEVATVTVPAGDGGELKDSYRYSKLDKPVTLHADTTYRIVIGVSRGGNAFLNYKGGDKNPQFSKDIAVTQPVFATAGHATKAAYPDENRGGTYHGVAYSGPNFQYEGTGKATAAPKVDPMAAFASGEPGPDNRPGPSDFPGSVVTSVDFESASKTVPDGWQVGPGTPRGETLSMVDFGAGGSSHALKVSNDWPMYRQSADSSLFYAFDKPVDRAAIEFDLKWTTRPHAAFVFFTKGPDSSAHSQVNISNGKATINQNSGIINGHHWIIPDGEKHNKGAQVTHWYRVRVVAAKDSNSINIWVSQPDQTTLPEKPTRTFPAYRSNQPIASVHFAVAGIWSNNYYLDNISIRTGDDIPAPPNGPDARKETLARGYQLWTGKTFPRTFEEIPHPEGLEFHIVDTARNWQHGASIAWHDGALYASWGANEHGENSPGEVVMGAKSTDGGKTWSKPFTIAAGSTENGEAYSNSHGLLMSHKGKLWGFFQYWKGGWDNPLAMEAFVLNEKTGDWESKGVVGRKGWPIDPPQRLDNGNWIIGLSGFKMRKPAAMISRGDDLLHWDTVQIPTPGDEDWMFAETSLIAYGNNVLSLTRRSNTAQVAQSQDGGVTWTTSEPSNFPNVANMSSGVLSTGQWFIVTNMRNREDLEIAVGKPGEKGVSKLYRIRYGSPDADHPYEGKAFPRAYAYPSTTEHDGKLYIIYSVDKQDIELAVIPIASLKGDDQ